MKIYINSARTGNETIGTQDVCLTDGSRENPLAAGFILNKAFLESAQWSEIYRGLMYSLVSPLASAPISIETPRKWLDAKTGVASDSFSNNSTTASYTYLTFSEFHKYYNRPSS